ncbi:MAG: carboxypeptidase regulatory-like domain-containing protein, partial [Bryobacterales bacterium]|nr:carboxypeptidase regulatory-like domain-containing protein [Bryobacterales bacterium]
MFFVTAKNNSHLEGKMNNATRRLRQGLRAYLPYLFCLTMLLCTAAWGQERFGEINGTATDPSGAVIPNVTVTVTNKGTGRVFQTQTGSDGRYVARNLEPGRYSVKFEMQGFAAHEAADVSLLLGRTLTVNAPMSVARAEQAVQVTEAAPLIDTTNTTIAQNITAEEFDRLPKARSFQNLAVLSPSVNSGVIEGGIQVNGASGAENNFTIDGISTNSLINGQ